MKFSSVQVNRQDYYAFCTNEEARAYARAVLTPVRESHNCSKRSRHVRMGA